MPSLRVNLGPRSYDIAVTTKDAAGVGPFARARCAGAAALIVTDWNVIAHARAVEQALRAAGFGYRVVALPAGEGQKAIEVAARLYDSLLDLQADRRTLVV